MSTALDVKIAEEETKEREFARNYLTLENLSTGLLISGNLLGDASMIEVVRELNRQTAAINCGDMTRAEDMLVAQAHSRDTIFAQLASRALRAKHMDGLESYMRLALKA